MVSSGCCAGSGGSAPSVWGSALLTWMCFTVPFRVRERQDQAKVQELELGTTGPLQCI